MQKKITPRAALMMVTAALIWGVAFVAQSAGMDHVGPFTFGCVRAILGVLTLLPVIPYLDKKLFGRVRSLEECGGKQLVFAGVTCGCILTTASMFQQFALLTTSAGKAGFLTTLYIIFVPMLGLFLRRKVGRKVYFAVAIAILGMYLLCVTESFTMQGGDLLVTFSAVIYACHILAIDHFAPKVDGVRMSAIQFAVMAVLCGILMFPLEQPTFAQVLGAWLPLVYTGVMSTGVAYTLQIVAQRDADPTVSSLLLSLESVFAVLAGWIILHEQLSPKELMGCALVFLAVILAQLPEKSKTPS